MTVCLLVGQSVKKKGAGNLTLHKGVDASILKIDEEEKGVGQGAIVV